MDCGRMKDLLGRREQEREKESKEGKVPKSQRLEHLK